MKVKDSDYQNHPESSVLVNVHSKKQLWAKQSDSSRPRYLGTIGRPKQLASGGPNWKASLSPVSPQQVDSIRPFSI